MWEGRSTSLASFMLVLVVVFPVSWILLGSALSRAEMSGILVVLGPVSDEILIRRGRGSLSRPESA